MSETATRLRKAVVDRALTGSGVASSAQRAAAFANAGVDDAALALVAKVAANAWQVADGDVAAATARLPEDAVFELAVCAALGEATRQLDSALAALATATERA